MKLQPRTIQILKNFSLINPSMVFKKGHQQVTMHPMKKILVRATIQEDMPADFAIFDLQKFIGTLSLFSEPEIEIGTKCIIISEKGQTVNFTFGDPDLIISPNVKTMKMPSEEIKFKLAEAALAQLNKASSILGLPHIMFVGDGKIIQAGTSKCDDPSANKFMVEVGVTKREFKFVIEVDNFRVLPGEYDATIAKEGFVHLMTKDIEYWMTTEAKFKQF